VLETSFSGEKRGREEGERIAGRFLSIEKLSPGGTCCSALCTKVPARGRVFRGGSAMIMTAAGREGSPIVFGAGNEQERLGAHEGETDIYLAREFTTRDRDQRLRAEIVGRTLEPGSGFTPRPTAAFIEFHTSGMRRSGEYLIAFNPLRASGRYRAAAHPLLNLYRAIMPFTL